MIINTRVLFVPFSDHISRDSVFMCILSIFVRALCIYILNAKMSVGRKHMWIVLCKKKKVSHKDAKQTKSMVHALTSHLD